MSFTITNCKSKIKRLHVILVLMLSSQHNRHREHFTAFSAAELMMAEAVGLVNTLDNWRVVDTIILSTKTPEKKKIFGKGNFQSLTGILQSAFESELRETEPVLIFLIICF